MAIRRICSVEDCGKPHLARGWCGLHYQRWSVGGDPSADRPARSNKGEAQRFFREVVLTYEGDECLIWPYSRDNYGYGYFGSGHAHRFSCEEANGPPPTPRHQAAHSCGKGHLGCVTKRHLSWKTHKGNAEDRLTHGVQQRGEDIGSAKLTEDQVREIRTLSGSCSLTHLAKIYGMSRAAISYIVARKTWTHVL